MTVVTSPQGRLWWVGGSLLVVLISDIVYQTILLRRVWCAIGAA